MPERVKTDEIARSVVNLRRDVADKGIWRRAGMPRKVNDVGVLPFARFSPFGDGREICLSVDSGNKLYYNIEEDSTNIEGDSMANDNPVELAVLPGRPILAVTAARGVIRLLISHKPDRYLTYDKDLNVVFLGPMPQLPPIQLAATQYNTLYGQVPAIKLTGGSTGSSGSQLCAADNQKLGNAIVATYESLRRRAAGSRYCVQPAMARYRLLDAAGNTLAVGPTVALSTVDGFSATGSIVQTSTDSMQTLSEGRMDMGVYRPGVIAPPPLPSPWDRIVSRLVIEMTAEIDPLIKDTATPHGIQRNSQSGMVSVTSKIPGFANGTVTDKARLRSLGFEGIKSPMRIAAEFCNPFGGGIGAAGAMVTFNAPDPTSPIVAGQQNIPGTERHCWSAALEAGDVTILCNPLRKSVGGWSPDCFVASHDDGDGTVWRLATSVRLSTAAGEVRLKRETGGLGNAPSSLSPVLSYPSEEATEMTVTYLSPTGIVYEESFPLTALPGSGIACHVSYGLERIKLTQTAEAYLPSGEEPPQRMEAGIAEICHSSDLGRVIDSRRISPDHIHAVRMLPRSGSGWDFARMKLLFFGEAGTILATVGESGRFGSVAPVDTRPVMSAGAVCDESGPSGASLLAYAGDDLIRISGQKVTTVAASIPRLLASRPGGNAGYKAAPCSGSPTIGWEGGFREVWMAMDDDSGRLLRVTEKGEIIEARLPSININQSGGADNSNARSFPTFRFAADRGCLLMATDNATFDLSDETKPGKMEVEMTRRMSTAKDPHWLKVNIFASSLSGTFTLSGDRGTEIAEPLLRLHFDGPVNAPVTVRLASPRRPWLEASVKLAASPDLAIHDETFLR